MTIDDARRELAAIAVNPRADFAHQDYVDEARRRADAGDDAALARLREALSALVLHGDELETMTGADALMAIAVDERLLRDLVAALPTLPSPRADAVQRILGVHRAALPNDVYGTLDALFLAHPRMFIRLALAVLPNATGAMRDTIWTAVVGVVDASDDLAELVLATRAAADVGRLDDLLPALRKKPEVLIRQIARDTMTEDRILPQLGFASTADDLAKGFASCTDPQALASLVRQAVDAGCVASLPRWLKQKDRALLRAAMGHADADTRPWFEAVAG